MPKKSAPGGSERPLKTLDRVLSKAGLGSRTEARKWIGAGRVEVNGKRVQTPDHWVDLERDRVTLDGKAIRQQSKLYLLLYKPEGYITTYQDPEGRPTVYDLIAEAGQFVGTVGRLDQDTSGLLLLTNDTQFAEKVTNPEHHVPKTYLVRASTVLTDEQLDRLRSGLTLSDGPTRPAIVRRVRDEDGGWYVEITIEEGRNRQVRRMFESVGSKVVKLARTAIGPIGIGELKVGEYRKLPAGEVKWLVL